MSSFGRFIIVPMLACALCAAAPEPGLSVDLLPSINQGIVCLLSQKYDLADSCWTSIPESPLYAVEREFYPLVTIATKYIDLEESEMTEESFLKRLEGLAGMCSERIRQDAQDMYARLYLGYTYGFMAMYYNYRKNLPSTLAYGFKAVSELERCIEIDPEFTEPYIAVGSYKYWRSSFLRKLRVPFTGDGRDEGISIVRRGIGSPLGDYLAWNQLAWIFIDYEKYDQALEAAGTALERYPGNRIMHWARAVAYKEAERHGEAAAEFRTILHSLENDGYYNTDTYYHVLYLEAEACFKDERYEEAKTICANITAIRTKSGITGKQKDIVRKAERLSSKCDEKM